MDTKNVVIVGATGAVGKAMIKCLDNLEFPVGNLRLVASERSKGKVVKTSFGEITLETISDEVFESSDIALFSAGGDISREWRDRVVAADCLMIDNSSAFRYEYDVPLVVPEINPDAAREHNGVIANPNCTTAIAAVVLWPLHEAFGLKKVIISTYQATSGAGAKGMQELLDQTRDVLEESEGNPLKVSKCHVEPRAFAHPIAFNIIPHIDKFQKNGYTKEEMKVTWETHKIFGDDSIAVSCTAVRIPTLRAHSESIVIETEKSVSVDEAREVLEDSDGVKVVDNPDDELYPMPLEASGKSGVRVGRIRQNIVFGENGLEFFISGDQLLKGAALNAVQIAKLFV
ncbi:aspartate-semialdehyde dehydrogenase [Candidatus Peregrinibacteria bacterium]|jgi:aspartate-semialdehyde dehydrogenase|nr:aspartate-semialdehyde dehydrogenase [Candidatus Peregrinibacteria bacterium]